MKKLFSEHGMGERVEPFQSSNVARMKITVYCAHTCTGDIRGKVVWEGIDSKLSDLACVHRRDGIVSANPHGRLTFKLKNPSHSFHLKLALSSKRYLSKIFHLLGIA